jgi:hypothetical protein
MRESKTYDKAVALNTLGYALIADRIKTAHVQPRIVGEARVATSDERRAERARFRARAKAKEDVPTF